MFTANATCPSKLFHVKTEHEAAPDVGGEEDFAADDEFEEGEAVDDDVNGDDASEEDDVDGDGEEDDDNDSSFVEDDDDDTEDVFVEGVYEEDATDDDDVDETSCGNRLTRGQHLASVNKQKYGLSASRPPVNSPSLAEVGLSSGRPGTPEAVGDFVPHSEARFPSDDLVAHRAQSSQDGNSHAFDETFEAAEGSSVNQESAASGGASGENDAAAIAASRSGRKAQNLLVLRASLGNEPRTYVMGMQCVCAYLGRAPHDPLPLDSEIMPLLRSLPSENL